ncbi:MAG: hypothetical protein ABI672_06530, partial [Vicinamibacteria bacterium]
MRSSNFSSARFLLLAVAVVVGFIAPKAQAQTATGFSEYFILGQDDHVWRFMNRVRSGEGSTAFPSPARLNSVASATSTQDGQRITYDHWEDGLETDITNPVQTSTLVLGDGVNSNGRVCDWTNDPRVFPCTGNPAHDDSIYIGMPMSFASDRGLAGACASPYLVAPDASQVNCSFPVSPTVTGITSAGTVATVAAVAHGLAVGQIINVSGANEAKYNLTGVAVTGVTANTFTYNVAAAGPTVATGLLRVIFPTLRFDGGDRVYSVGGSLSIAHIQDPGTPLIGGGTELLARELVKNAVSYSVPVGEDLYPGTNNVFQSIKYAALDIVAFDDNTSITITSPGAGGGTRSVVLHRGQSYSTCADFGTAVAGLATGSTSPCDTGAIDGPPPPSGPDNRGIFAGLALKITAGTKIATSGPLNTLIFTGGGSATGAQYQTRHYATLPDILHATDYVMTAPGGITPRADLFIYNPNPTAAITVTQTTTAGTTSFSVPANSVVDYRNNSGAGTFVPANSTVRLTSNRQFWGLSAYDSLALSQDWGHAWLGTRFLTTDYTVAYSPGTQNTPIVTITHAGGVVTGSTGVVTHQITNGSRVRISGVGVPTPITTLTSVGATATATRVAHGLVLGQSITIEGALSAVPPNNYNGQFLVTGTTANTFTYTMVAPSGSPTATGAPIFLVPSVVNGERVLTASGGTTFSFALAGASANAQGGVIVGICNGTGTQPCDSYNRNPVWVAGTQNNTQVKVDLDSDGLWDFIDTDSDGCPNSGIVVSGIVCETPVVVGGCAAPTAGACTYTVNAPGSAGTNSLRVWDPYDQDNAGTRIVASRPVALSWGEDIDQGTGADPSPDNGYTIYPGIALDLVLGLEKTVSPSRVPLAGGVADYTVRVFAGDYGPLNFVSVKDRLPVGILCSAYVPGSTVITYPDMSTTTVDPVCTNGVISSLTSSGTTATATSANHGYAVGERVVISGATSAVLPNNYNGTFTVTSITLPNQFTYTMTAASGSTTATGAPILDNGRNRLKWNPTPATLDISQEVVIRYKMNIPATGASRTLVND